MVMRRIYLDYAASTPLAPEVLEAMTPYFLEKFGNPSSLHSYGREAEIISDESRETIAQFFGVDFGEIYFTSGATEANNWMIYMAAHMPHGAKGKKPHIVTSAFEHESLLELVEYLEGKGIIEATYIKPSKKGFIDPKKVEAALKENTVLVSIIYVNNEVGIAQPIKEIGKIIEKHKKTYKLQATNYQLPIFHSDGVQAIQFYEPRLDWLKLDAMTISGHKLHGPKGIGALIVKKLVWMKPLLYGGGQEFSFRSGTLNVPGIVGLAKAIEMLGDEDVRRKEGARLLVLKKRLETGIMNIFPDAFALADDSLGAPHILNVVFPKRESQILLIAFDQEGLAVSSGAACSTKAQKPSYVLLSMGFSAKEATASLRFSIGRYTTLQDIDDALEAMGRVGKKCNHH